MERLLIQINAPFDVKKLDLEELEKLSTEIQREIISIGGVGSAVLELLQERGLFSVQMKRLGIPDCFVEHGPQNLLRVKYGIDEDGIFKEAKDLVEKKRVPSFSSMGKEPVPSNRFPMSKYGDDEKGAG
jgi:deoxyxylulose-5-phosphate synthase